MSKRISIAQLKWKVTRAGGQTASPTEVLALVELAEAAHAYWTAPSMEVGDPRGTALNQALLRFDFSEPA